MAAQQHQTEERASGKRVYRTVAPHALAKIPVMAHRIDRDGRLIEVSDPWLEAFGYRRQDVIGRRSVEFLTPESRRYAETVTLPNFWQQGHAGDVPYQFVKKRGEIVEMRLSGTAESDEEGEPIRSIAILTEIAHRTRDEQEVRRASTDTSGGADSSTPRENAYGLTGRELTVLDQVSAGRTDKEVAKELGLSPLTVRKHVANIRAKMDASSRTEAGVRAVREGLLE